MSDEHDFIALMRLIPAKIARLPVGARIDLLCVLLMQEVCMLPADKRAAALESILGDLPDIFRGTEDGMRIALVDNARRGL